MIGKINVDMLKVTGIYKITSPTGRVYIGQSKDIKRRFSDYNRLKCKRQKRLYESFKKYRVEAHQFDIIEYCTLEQLNCSERFWQDEFDVISKNGLNCVLSQCGQKRKEMTQETKDKISESNRGKTRSKEFRKKMSDDRKGEKSIWFGKKHSEETKNKISDSNKGKVFTKEHRKNLSLSQSGEKSAWYGRTHTEETKKKMSEWQLGEGNHQAKLVLDLATGIFYETAKEASVVYGINYVTLNCYLNGRFKNKTNLIYV